MPTGTGERWARRNLPADLVERYRAAGWWTDGTLGATVADGLATMGSDTPFRVHSKVRPWSGTFAEVDRAARGLAAELARRGVGAGDVVVIQLPNWVEAGIAFWAAAYLGAVVVPVVHFYGPKELAYILEATEPAVVITADRFGRSDYLSTYESLLEQHPVPLWLVAGETPASGLPPAARHLSGAVDGPPATDPAPVDPDSPVLVAFTSGTTRNPKGVVHSNRTIGFETRQLDTMMAKGGPPEITGAPVGHFIGMLNAFLVPLLRRRPVNLVDVWDPGEVLRLMVTEGVGISGGATYFLTSLLDHPDFTPDHLALMPHAGLGGSTVPVAVTERATHLGIRVFRSYGSTEHPSITGCVPSELAVKRLRTDGHPLCGVEIRLTEEGEILSRGPDCCIGYTDAELTARAFDEQGWYRTGDVGVLDEDGYLTITDRLSDVIIRGGENVSAQEVEEVLLAMDGIAEVSVVGAPDDRLGERVAAVVRLRPGVEVPSLAAVRAHLASVGLARQKWPESLHPVSDFPRTASGKVQKFRLRQALRDGSMTTAPVAG